MVPAIGHLFAACSTPPEGRSAERHGEHVVIRQAQGHARQHTCNHTHAHTHGLYFVRPRLCIDLRPMYAAICASQQQRHLAATVVDDDDVCVMAIRYIIYRDVLRDARQADIYKAGVASYIHVYIDRPGEVFRSEILGRLWWWSMRDIGEEEKKLKSSVRFADNFKRALQDIRCCGLT